MSSYAETLTAETAAPLMALRDPRRPCVRRYMPHIPHPKQAAMLHAKDVRELLFGGAAGGGKTDALLMDSLQYVCVPGYAAVLLRKNFPQLAREGGLMDRAQDWLAGTDAHWVATLKRWEFPSGATLSLAFAERDIERYNFAGPEFQYAGFDELTTWATDRIYRYVGFARVRGPKPSPDLPACPECGLTLADVPHRTRGGTNPGGEGGQWVYDRFIADWRAWKEGKRPDPPARVFLPSYLKDNPSLDYEQYVEGLNELDPVERAQMLEGDWDVREKGGLFERQWFTVVADWPREAKLCRYWDLAATEVKAGTDPDWTVGALVALHAGRWWVVDVKRVRATPAKVEALVRQTAEVDAQTYGRGVQIVMEQEPGSGGVNTIDHYRRNVLAGHSFRADKVSTGKVERARVLSSAAEAGNVALVAGPWNGAWLDEADVFPMAGAHDDQIDAVVGGMVALTGSGRGGLRAR